MKFASVFASVFLPTTFATSTVNYSLFTSAGLSSTTITEVACYTCFGPAQTSPIPTNVFSTTLDPQTTTIWIVSVSTLTVYSPTQTLTFVETDTITQTVTFPPGTRTEVTTTTTTTTITTTEILSPVVTPIPRAENDLMPRDTACRSQVGAWVFPTAVDSARGGFLVPHENSDFDNLHHTTTNNTLCDKDSYAHYVHHRYTDRLTELCP
ncbi:hypothetical protein BX600DRAFT_438181 [Xylariales sp. PMI_506]|nr:hypothetical protein BX600DRAFT_438181 [Xylariales sp. PMI_506]